MPSHFPSSGDDAAAGTTMTFGIGELARRAGCKPETVRYYEQIGLLPKAQRNAGNQRIYAESSVHRLGFIRHARDFGFSVDSVRELLSMADQPAMPCAQVDALARRHLQNVESRIERLSALRDELKRTIEQCSGGSVAKCHIIDILSDYAHDHHQGPHGGADVLG